MADQGLGELVPCAISGTAAVGPEAMEEGGSSSKYGVMARTNPSKPTAGALALAMVGMW